MALIEKEGRKAYDSRVHRIARGFPDRQPEEGYISWQTKINSGPGKTINENKLRNYLDKHNYEEIEPEFIDNLSPGSRIAYITNENKWRSGGFLIRIEQSFMDAEGELYEEPKIYILYKSFNNAVFSVQLEDVNMFYTKKKMEILMQKMIYFKRPIAETKFPVTLENADGDDIIVHFARDNFNQKKFMDTEKYKLSKQDPEIWAFEDGSQTEIDL